MQINILTLFPDFFSSPLQVSILKRAIDKKQVFIQVIDIRNFSTDKHQKADDRPFGGGPGMVMQVEPIERALESLGCGLGTRANRQKIGKHRVFLTSAKGKLFTQNIAKNIAESIETLTLICGHYEGVDERVAEHLVDGEIRIGDYVITGGEAAALVISDSVIRLLPGVLGNEASHQDESHSIPGKMGFGQYTRPDVYKELSVPEVLLSGNHEKIKNWREKEKKP